MIYLAGRMLASAGPGPSMTLTAERSAAAPLTGIRPSMAGPPGGQGATRIDLGPGEAVVLSLGGEGSLERRGGQQEIDPR